MGRSEVPLRLRGLSDRVNAFDLLELDGEDLRGELIEWRKYALAQLPFTRGTPRGLFGRNGLMAAHSKSVSS